MRRPAAISRICLALMGLTLCALWTAECVGLLPNHAAAVVQGRAKLCECVGLNCLRAAQRGDWATLRADLRTLKERNPEIESAAVRAADGRLRVEIGDHARHWPSGATCPTATFMQVPILMDNQPWGTVEVRFAAARQWGPRGRLLTLAALSVFVGAVAFLTFYLYLRRVLRQLDPGHALPHRVRVTLDTLAEGVVVLDPHQRIVLANEAFADAVGRSPGQLQGLPIGALAWNAADQPRRTATAPPVYPWVHCLTAGAAETECVLRLDSPATGRHLFRVNAAPITGDDGVQRGVLATFSDVTTLQVRNSQLNETLEKLELSRDQIRQQNEQLRSFATCDPLTGCLNRRAFFEALEQHLHSAPRSGRPLSYLILDIDHFKAINDNHGHATGDDVLRETAAVVRALAPPQARVCRYGGEEFSVLLPNTALAEAADFAERLRHTLETTAVANLRVAVSVGVAEFNFHSREPRHALDQADRALDAAKRGGRNRVVRADQVPAEGQGRRATWERGPGLGAADLPTAAVSILAEIAHRAEALRQTAHADPEGRDILRMTAALSELCQLAQQACRADPSAIPPTAARPPRAAAAEA